MGEVAGVVARGQRYEVAGIDRLTPHPENPRRGDLSSLLDSFDENGFYGAVVAQRSSGHVLAGNHRLLAARERGATQLPVIWLDVDDDRARRILLVDNRANDLAGYDDAALVDVLRDLVEGAEEPAVALAGTGYSHDDLDDLVRNLTPPSADDWSAAVGAAGGDADGPGTVTRTFSLTRAQAVIVDAAIDAAAADDDGGGEGGNRNARSLTRVAEAYRRAAV